MVHQSWIIRGMCCIALWIMIDSLYSFVLVQEHIVSRLRFMGHILHFKLGQIGRVSTIPPVIWPSMMDLFYLGLYGRFLLSFLYIFSPVNFL